MKTYLPILLLLLSACGGRPAANAPKEDPRITEEKRLRELFPEAPYIITRQEQLDSLLILEDAKIAEHPSPEAYLHRLSLYAAGQQWEKELQDAEDGLLMLPPDDTSQLALTLRFAKASAANRLCLYSDAIAEYQWLVNHADSITALEANECLADVIQKAERIILQYDEPINGYNARIEWEPKTSEAEFFFTKEGESFSVKPWLFKPEWFNMAIDGCALHYRPKLDEDILDPEEPFFFQDIDYDGVDELLVVEIQGGPRGSNAYRVFELDGTEREDEPFYEISDWTSFNPSEKTITLNYNYGVLIGGYRMKYRHLKDGMFVETDSIHVEYKADYSDSIRTYYRKQGDKMVLVKKEIL